MLLDTLAMVCLQRRSSDQACHVNCDAHYSRQQYPATLALSHVLKHAA